MNPAADRVSSTKEARDKKVLARDSDQSFTRCAFKKQISHHYLESFFERMV